MCCGCDLIRIQFQIKQQAKHRNYVDETFNYVVIVTTMLKGFK